MPEQHLAKKDSSVLHTLEIHASNLCKDVIQKSQNIMDVNIILEHSDQH